MNFNLFKISTLILLTAASVPAFANDGVKGYVTDTRNAPVKSGFGLCWRTGTWTPADATFEGCDGVLAKAPSATQSNSNAGTASASATAPVPEVKPTTTAPASAAQAPSADKVTFEADAFFDFDKSVLKPEGKARLTDLVSKLQGTDIEVILATGHTDSIGSDAYNQKLSIRRAQAVKAFLVSKGMKADRIFTDGKGEKQPVASNQTREGRAKNRRVEVEVVGKRTN